MPSELVHLDDAELTDMNIAPGLLAAFRAYLPEAPNDPRGATILAPASSCTRELLMVLARRVGAALRDENIALRERGGDLRADRKKMCYLPGSAIPMGLRDPSARQALAGEAACFIQDLDQAWGPEEARSQRIVDGVLRLLSERCGAGLPTFISAAPDRLPRGVERELRERLMIITPLGS